MEESFGMQNWNRGNRQGHITYNKKIVRGFENDEGMVLIIWISAGWRSLMVVGGASNFEGEVNTDEKIYWNKNYSCRTYEGRGF